MSRRRGFGNIRKTSSGRYQARYQAPDGTYRPGPQTFRTMAEAETFLADMRRMVAGDRWIDPKAQLVTLNHYSGDWLPARPLSPRTAALYADQLRLHILPELGRYPVARISPATVRSWHAALAKRTGATATRQSYSLLRAILNTAITDQLIERNPCQIRGAGSTPKSERPLLSFGDVAALTEAIDPSLRTLTIVTFWCHCRLGEVLALQHGDVNLVEAKLHIRRQLVRVRKDELRTTQPKAGSLRTVAIPAPAVDALRRHLSEHPGLPTAPVFTRSDGSRLQHHHVHGAWNRARVEVELPRARFHDLRHASLTLAAMSGATLREVMGRAGHSTVAAAMGYQHNAEHRGAEIAAAMTRLVEELPTADMAHPWHTQPCEGPAGRSMQVSAIGDSAGERPGQSRSG
jgi:integrase